MCIYIYIVGSWNHLAWNSLHNFGVSIPSNGALTIAHGKISHATTGGSTAMEEYHVRSPHL